MAGSATTSAVTIKEYRGMLGDVGSTDQQIQDRIEYLESFVRSIIRIELEKHEKENIHRIPQADRD